MNECGLLDLTRADLTAENKSPYRIGEGQGDRRLYICDFAICDSDIASGDRIGGGMGGRINFE